jgi:kynureninase
MSYPRTHAEALDESDPLAHFRERFFIPDGVIYLDGNSLGALPQQTKTRIEQVVQEEWGSQLIQSWNTAGWIDLPTRIGAKIAKLIGANADEVVVTDSTSINLFKVLASALKQNAARRVIVTEKENFPTDLYIAQGLIDLLGHDYELRWVSRGEIESTIDERTAVVMLTHVNYRNGRVLDMDAITKRAHEKGALTIWDLSHSVGAMSVDLNRANADFAVGCGYKYLNGGPGAPAFVFVAKRHHEDFSQPLTGWLGHAQPFAFDWQYTPAEGIARAMCGTPPVLSLSALECGVDLFLEADINALREKSLRLTDLFIALVQPICKKHQLELITPTEQAQRGSQVSLTHARGYPIIRALIARGVIGDFRAPNILRFGFAPLYLRFVDVWDAAYALGEILESGDWRRDVFDQKEKVT